jgi:hypothetical protein
MLRYALALIVVASAIFGGTAIASAPDPFAGAWYGTDESDGSDVRVQISMDANGVRTVVFTDNRTGSQCGGGPARAISTGTVSGLTLTVSGTIRCPNFTVPFDNGHWYASPSGDSLTDDFGLELHRQGS